MAYSKMAWHSSKDKGVPRKKRLASTQMSRDGLGK